jgi:hypothetical protein
MLTILDRRGEHLLITNLGKNTPTIKDDMIQLEVATDIAQIEILSQQKRLLAYICKSLNNYNISLQITVNKENTSNLAYTSEEKYKVLKEQNPYLETFIRELGLQF